MTFSPRLEARFDKLMKSYPPGRQRSAMVPMLLYAQEEVGAVTPELVAEVTRGVGVQPLQVEGTLIADVIAAIGSMDFVLGDTDR